MPEMKETPTKSSDLEYTYTFTSWSPNIVAATKNATYEAQFKSEERLYTVNVYYKDKDGARNNESPIISEPVSHQNVKFGASINVERQMMLKSSYLLYVTPVSTFSSWNTNENFIVDINEDIVTVIVLCVQPAAVVSTSATLSWSDDTNYSISKGKFYKDVTSALAAIQGNEKAEFLRIYGQSKTGSSSEHIRLPDDSSINQSNVIIGESRYIVSSYNYDFSNYTVKSNITIDKLDTVILPYSIEDSTSEGYITKIETPDPKKEGYIPPVVSSLLIIDENITITINGKFTVGGMIGGTKQNDECTVYDRAVVMNHGTVIANSNSTLIAYGFIKGSGSVEIKNGAVLKEVFRVYDWPGGTKATAIYKTVFPIQCYSIHNVSCSTKINYGAKLTVYFQVEMQYVGWQTPEITLLGSGGIFEITNKDGYILKSVEGAENSLMNQSYVSSNQDITQKEILEVYADIIDNSQTISIKAPLVGSVDLNINTEQAMPIGFMKIILKPGSKANLGNISYKFLPGSSLTIENGAELNLGSEASLIFFNEFNESNAGKGSWSYDLKHSDWYKKLGTDEFGAQLVINGKLVSNGYIGGIAKSTGSGLMYVNNNSASTKVVSEWTNYTSTTVNFTGTINNNTNSQFSTGQWYFYDNNTWKNITSVNINYELNGGLLDNVEPSKHYFGTDTENLPTPIRDGYTFVGWYDNVNCNGEALKTLSGYVYFEDITLYAKWTQEQVCTVTFNTGDGSTISPVKVIKGHSFSEPADPTKTGYTFVGWYSDQSLSQIYDFSTPVSTNITIYAKWELASYTVIFDPNGGKWPDGTSATKEFTYKYGATITYPSQPTKDATDTHTYTFTSWSRTDTTMPAEDITIKAVWKESAKGCFAEGTLILMGDGTYQAIENLKAGDIIMTWNFHSGNYEAMPISLYWNHGESLYEIINLEFSNGNTIKVILEHGLFSVEENKFVYINASNYNNYIGKQFVAYGENQSYEYVTLNNAYVTTEITGNYSLRSAFNDNAIAYNMFTLTVEDYSGMLTYFEVGDNMKYDKEKMEADINAYGLYSFEEWSDYFTVEEFYALNGQYFKVLVGKGIVTRDDIMALIAGLRDENI